MDLTLARIGRTALDLLYPPRCVLCGHGGDFICASCREKLPRAAGSRCDACWLPGVDYCYKCAERPLALERLRSAFRYEDDVKRLIHAIKFRHQSCLAEPLAIEMEPLLSQADPDAGLLVPVPMLGWRQRQRGFNQAQLLAKRLGAMSGLPVVEALSRRHNNGTQVGSPTAAERWRRVEGAFAVRQPGAIAGERIILIDDVATTGATLDACARALLDAGALAVSAVTFGRED
jgi:competence protein ComFC